MRSMQKTEMISILNVLKQQGHITANTSCRLTMRTHVLMMSDMEPKAFPLVSVQSFQVLLDSGGHRKLTDSMCDGCKVRNVLTGVWRVRSGPQ